MNTAFQKVYTKITQITKATCSLKAQGVGNDELAIVNGRFAQVVKIWGDDVTLQVFSGTEGIPTNAEVTFLGKAPTLKVGDDLCGRFFNAFGEPIDGGPVTDGEEREIYRLLGSRLLDMAEGRQKEEEKTGHIRRQDSYIRMRSLLKKQDGNS